MTKARPKIIRETPLSAETVAEPPENTQYVEIAAEKSVPAATAVQHVAATPAPATQAPAPPPPTPTPVSQSQPPPAPKKLTAAEKRKEAEKKRKQQERVQKMQEARKKKAAEKQAAIEAELEKKILQRLQKQGAIPSASRKTTGNLRPQTKKVKFEEPPASELSEPEEDETHLSKTEVSRKRSRHEEMEVVDDDDDEENNDSKSLDYDDYEDDDDEEDDAEREYQNRLSRIRYQIFGGQRRF
jgi:hypothetical protein